MTDTMPRSQLEFEERFRDEESCMEFVRSRRWPKGFSCPKCQHERAWQLRSRALDQCARCGRQVSVTAGTIFEGTRKPLVVWFRVIGEMMFSKAGCSALELTRRFGLHYKTAWTWQHKLRSVMDRAWGNPLAGLVEVDETYIGGRDPGEKRGRSLAGKKVLVAAAVEFAGKTLGRVRLRAIPAASKSELVGFVTTSVVAGSTVKTDGLAAYKGLNVDYLHERVVVGNPKNASRLFPAVHRVFSLLDRWILGTLQGSFSRKHIQRHLDEFMFRFNRRSSRDRSLLIWRLVDGCVKKRPPTYRALADGPSLQLGAT